MKQKITLPELPTPRSKREAYAQLVEQLNQDWDTDWEMYTTDVKKWTLAHQIDEWLHQVREHPDVSVEAYQAQCQRMRALYEAQRKQLDLTGLKPK